MGLKSKRNFKDDKRNKITWEDALIKWENPEDVPEEIKEELMGLEYTDDEFHNEFYAHQEGYSSYKEFENSLYDQMYPDGYDPDIDGTIIKS